MSSELLDDGVYQENDTIFQTPAMQTEKRKATADLPTLQGSIELRYNLADFSSQVMF